MSSTYNKPFLTVEAQVERLRERGMRVSDADACIRELQAIGYYRLSGYWYPFRAIPDELKEPRPSEFAAGTTFDEVLEVYYFDEQLRLEMLRAIARIEVSLRFWVGHKLGRRGPFAHIEATQLDPSWSAKQSRKCPNPNCSESCTWDESAHNVWVAKQRRIESISNEAFVAHIYGSYGEPLPVWAATETMTFETLNRLYGGMVAQDREQIAVEFDILREDGNGDARAFANWIEHLRQTRNFCAHHARLWNRNHTAPPVVPESADELKHLLASAEDTAASLPMSRSLSRIYGTLTLVAYLLARIDYSNSTRDRLRKLIVEFVGDRPERLRAMGFPPGWEDQEIWAEGYGRESAKREQLRLLRDVELLYTKDAAEKLQTRATETERRSLLNYYRKRGAVLSVPGTSAHRYPAFQFDKETGDLRELVVLANRRLLDGGAASEEARWVALQWWQSPIQARGEAIRPIQAVQDGALTRGTLDKFLPPRDDE